ncbi:MAG: caspase family protein, partial [Rhizobiaceae bacterium]
MTRSKKLLGYAALSAATFLCTAGIAVAETRVALVIGNAAYEKLSPLSNPVIDAERMAQMLAANGFDVMSCDGAKPGCFNLDRSGMTDALEAFELKARGADVAMVFYAGHGMQTAKGNVLAPVNMELSCDTLDPLKATMLDNVMDALSDAKDKIIIIDACRNDPFQAQQCAQRGGRSLSFGSIAVPDSDSRFLLMSSTKPGQFAADGLPGAHSPFAESLFYWMEQQPNAYFDQLLDRVAKRVIERSTEAKFTQVPEVLIRGGAPESCLSGDCSTDPEGAALRNEVAALKVENERSQEYEEIVTTMLRSAGYTSLEELPADQRDSFFKGIVSASRALGERNDSAGEQALAALKQGDENAAAALFEQELEERAKGAASELTKAAESARHLAALAWPKDVAKAAKYFGEATRYDPNNIQTWMDYAQTSQASGNTSEALRAYGEATRLAAQDGTVSQRIWATLGQGDIVRAQGRLDRALELYVSANDLAQENSAALPGDLNARREIYASHLVIGDIQMEQGKLDASAKSYEDGLAIMREVSAANPQVSEWQRDISITLNRIGDVRSQQGRLAASLQAYEEGRDIVARLVEAEPNVVGWQRDLSISHERIGNAQFARGDLAAALVAYRQSLELRQAIAAMDPTNKEWQRDLSFSYERLADVRMAQGGLQAALESYEESRAIRKKLVEADPAHTGWQRDLAMSSQRIGEALRLLGRLSEAQAEFEFAKETVARLAASDPGNTLWQRDVAYSDTKLGEMWGVLGNPTGALEFYRSALAVTEKLAASDVTNAGLQRELAIAYNRVGDMLKIIADNIGALKSFESAMEISARLSASDPDNTDWQRDVS